MALKRNPGDNTIESTDASVQLVGVAGTQQGIIQQVHVVDGTVNTGIIAIPFNNTIPQITEGDEYMTLAITPTNTNNILIIDALAHISHTGSSTGLTVALFNTDVEVTDALAVGAKNNGTGLHIQQLSIRHRMTAGTTSLTTFRVRAAGAAGATTTFNGSNSLGLMGGVLASYITITELLP
ncbi:hypothetical protein LCGC14_1213690 [marine sediment metagenome]|uniref:Uncharacterized protein n=1 Tax=marine sediment metagenome TaxID=412755 RepID=A0A0F9LDD6_9ZZZZ